MEKGSAMFLCFDTKAGCLDGSSTGWSIFSDKKSYSSELGIQQIRIR